MLKKDDLARHLISRDATMKVERHEVLQVLMDARNRLCEGCRRGMDFNMNGSHGFDIHARPCQALEIRALILAELCKRD